MHGSISAENRYSRNGTFPGITQVFRFSHPIHRNGSRITHGRVVVLSPAWKAGKQARSHDPAPLPALEIPQLFPNKNQVFSCVFLARKEFRRSRNFGDEEVVVN